MGSGRGVVVEVVEEIGGIMWVTKPKLQRKNPLLGGTENGGA